MKFTQSDDPDDLGFNIEYAPPGYDTGKENLYQPYCEDAQAVWDLTVKVAIARKDPLKKLHDENRREYGHKN